MGLACQREKVPAWRGWSERARAVGPSGDTEGGPIAWERPRERRPRPESGRREGVGRAGPRREGADGPVGKWVGPAGLRVGFGLVGLLLVFLSISIFLFQTSSTKSI